MRQLIFCKSICRGVVFPPLGLQFKIICFLYIRFETARSGTSYFAGFEEKVCNTNYFEIDKLRLSMLLVNIGCSLCVVVNQYRDRLLI